MNLTCLQASENSIILVDSTPGLQADVIFTVGTIGSPLIGIKEFSGKF